MPRLTALVMLCALAGCQKTQDVYEITVTLDSNTCGANALPLKDGLSYRTQFETDAPKATWKVLPKGSPITGSFNEDTRAFHFSVTQTLSLDGMDAGAGQLQCTVLRNEMLTGTLDLEQADAGVGDGGPDDFPLKGMHVISFSADSNGSCRGSAGPLGPFDRLPCAATYDIVGEPKEDK